VLLGTFSEFVEFDKQREKEGNRRSLGTTTKSRKTEPEAILDPKPAAGGGMGGGVGGGSRVKCFQSRERWRRK